LAAAIGDLEVKVFYHQGTAPNVGDDLNAILWSKLMPGLDQLRTADWLIGIGTILDERVNHLEGSKLVLGSGLRTAHAPRRFGADVRFAAVRGKHTAARLGLAADVAVCDPGFLVTRLWPDRAAGGDRIGLVPHVYSTRMTEITRVATDAGIEVVSPALPIDEFLAKLKACARVYCESLHGAIFADALRIPWARVRICSHYYEGSGVSDFKWADTFSVLGVDSQPMNRIGLLPIKRTWQKLARALRPAQALAEKQLVRELKRRSDSGGFRLSEASVLEERVSRLWLRISEVSAGRASEEWPSASPGTGSQNREGKRTRILMFPKDGGNAFLSSYSNSIAAQGAHVDEFNFPRAFTRKYDAFHIHWPDTHLRTPSWWRAAGKHARLALLCGVMRARGTKVVWMLHNLKPHEKDHWISVKLFPLWFPKACTHVIALTEAGLLKGHQIYPDLVRKRAAIVPHGHYRDAYPAPPSREEARKRLGLATHGFTYLFFGSIRRYKNVPELIQRFRALDDAGVELVVAGSPFGMEASELEAARGGDPRVHLHLRFVPDHEVSTYLAASHVAVLPFEDVLNSGSVLLVLSFNRPVLAPRIGALPEIQASVGSDWLHLYDGRLNIQLLRDEKVRLQPQGAPDLSGLSWDAIGKRALEFYQGP
jgi:beta-1,4-mannosyltransferase